MKHLARRRSILRWTVVIAGAAILSGCHATWHVPPGQIGRQTTPAATGTAPGKAKEN